MKQVLKYKRVVLLVVGCFFILSIFAIGTGINNSFATEAGDLPYAEDELIVVFKKDVGQAQAEELATELGSETLEVLENEKAITGLVTLDDDQSVESELKKYEKNPEIAYAQPNFCYKLEKQAQTLATNDSYFKKMWHFDKIKTSDTWDLFSRVDSKKTRVAVLDTGVVTTHTDLQKNLNKGLCADTSSGTKTTTLKGDDDGHGTHVTGIIGATANNKIGVAGVASGSDNSLVEVFAVDVFKKDGYAYTDGIVRGIEYAKKNGAKVINLSLGYEWPYPKDLEDIYFEDAVDNAAACGITVVCAAGNYSESGTVFPSDFDSTVSVIAVDETDKKTSASGYGSAKNIAAPGEKIYSTWTNPRYLSESGTSMASPIVAGTAAMLYSIDPEITVDEVKEILYKTAVDIYGEGEAYSQNGRVNAYDAVRKAAKIKSLGIEDKVVRHDEQPALNPVFTPIGTLDKRLTWMSSDPDIASVDETSGKITGKRIGEIADITAVSVENPDVSSCATVTVGYNINYVMNSGKNHKSNPSAYYGETIQLKKPTRTGYTFVGWYEDSSYTKKVTSLSEGDHKLYAKWKKVTVGKPAITSLKKTSASKLRVSYKKVSGGKGYEIKVSTSKNFTKSTTKTVATSITPKTVTGLKKNKKYYVKVRAYKIDSASKKVYGKYSAVKSKK